MCLSCDTETDAEKKIRISYQISNFIKAHPHIEGQHMVMRNYLKGTWSKEFITAHPKIIQRHTEGYIWDIPAFFADCDARIEAHGGDGKKAWLALNEEFIKQVNEWAGKRGCAVPQKDILKKASKEQLAKEKEYYEVERKAKELVSRVSFRRPLHAGDF